jgi:hypothetical protein
MGEVVDLCVAPFLHAIVIVAVFRPPIPFRFSYCPRPDRQVSFRSELPIWAKATPAEKTRLPG